MIKGFVITKIGDSISEEMADNCISSGVTKGFNIEKFAGIYKNIEELLQKENLFPNPQAHKKLKNKGIFGCFLSHYTLWNRCVELDHPIAIFEYDAEIINTLSENILDLFDDYLNLDYSRHLYLKDKEIYVSSLIQSDNIKISKLNRDNKTADSNSFKFMNRNHIKGAFGYILKPAGAKKLINGIKQDGVIPADIALNLHYLNVNYTEPSVARLNSTMLNDLTGLSHTKN
jgi:GR25 family glycosyltransferase involved in LPS biosynthesis